MRVTLSTVVLIYLFLSRRSNQREAVFQKDAAARLESEVEIRTREVERELEKRHEAEQMQAALELRLVEADKLRTIGQQTLRPSSIELNG